MLRNKLESSGLDPADGRRLGLTTVNATAVVELGLWKNFPKSPALKIPYIDPWGNVIDFARYRAFREPVPKPKRWPKYVQPFGSSVNAYFPALRSDWKKILQDPTHRLIITEGELKAAKACKEGFATLGLGGVWNFRQQKVFLDSLARIKWEGRSVYLAYDSDLATNENVERARQELANTLISHGAEVFRVDLPSLTGKKTGLDDFLIARGAPAFAALIEAAPPMTVDWKLFYQWGETGPLLTASNVLVALRNAPELQQSVAFDEMQAGAVMARTTPGDNANCFPHPASDIDVARIQVWLQRDGGLTKIGLEAVRTAVDIYAHENSFHPVRDWLAELRWDGAKRLDAWLTTVFGVEATSYSARIGRMFLIAMVARVMEPGCKMDYMLVIDSAQGIKKSSVFEILAGEWFSDAIPKLGSDEIRASMHIRGKWLIEDAELASRGRSSIEEVKQFISRRVERYTPKHGRKEVHEPRQCVFAGTTNELTYLKDETGNRRFWPVSANIDEARDTWLVANRDQLFAEALVAYRAKEPWWPDRKFEEKYIVPEQDARFSGDEWDSTIAKFLDLALKHPHHKITTVDALEGGLGIAVKDIRPGQTVKVGNVIRRLGWISKCSHGKRWYEPGPKVRKK